ncbi:hypothetical protein QQ045_032311 [Rhodiola kirilowii]
MAKSSSSATIHFLIVCILLATFFCTIQCGDIDDVNGRDFMPNLFGGSTKSNPYGRSTKRRPKPCRMRLVYYRVQYCCRGTIAPECFTRRSRCRQSCGRAW